MKILLADDERLTRLGLQNMIEELYPGAHHFTEASDGENLLELLKEETPDLIFLDIHMPRLTGLQAFSKFRDQKIPVVMLTGYAEFAYAREALKLGALDYLLKPASLGEVKTTMEKASALYEERELLLRKDYELEFEKLLDLYTTIGFLQSPRYVLPPYTSILFYFDQYSKETFKNDLEALKNFLSPICSRHRACFAITFLTTGEVCFLTSAPIPSGEMKHALRSFNQTDGRTVTGFYIQAENLSGFFRQLESVQREESLRCCVCLGSLITEQERRACSRLLPLSELVEKLLVAHRAGDAMGFRSLLTALSNLPNADRLLRLCDHSLNRILTMESGIAADIRSSRRLIEFLTVMNSQKQNRNLIDRINAYVEDNYMNQIGINTIADMIDISPNYLSKIYKLKTGVNFIDHLTAVRIKKAAELMAGGHTSTVRETAQRVGYFSTRYFAKVFLKNMGTPPSAYLKNHLLDSK